MIPVVYPPTLHILPHIHVHAHMQPGTTTGACNRTGGLNRAAAQRSTPHKAAHLPAVHAARRQESARNPAPATTAYHRAQAPPLQPP
eukprot:CAMPEP_0181339206 /NCGR_PEP_ID=MMETSP1101-20121128/29105_1 /TAXON_ID=46948 /ORGANISM="Rhodomonas abbreviata, Strain Caron Lab Isolate" /LENGTH=86 /DNA_ID=CAMNT_0023450105 /DNA_START=35 /DNA_END=291 /DNA_ORIENTATION=+